MRTELQYNLQKARALATELRVTLEGIEEFVGKLDLFLHIFGQDREEVAGAAGYIEDCLDSLSENDPKLIGEGSVALSFESFP